MEITIQTEAQTIFEELLKIVKKTDYMKKIEDSEHIVFNYSKNVFIHFHKEEYEDWKKYFNWVSFQWMGDDESEDILDFFDDNYNILSSNENIVFTLQEWNWRIWLIDEQE